MKNLAPMILALVVLGATLGAYGYLASSVASAVARMDEAAAGEASLASREDAARAAGAFLAASADTRATLESYVLSPDGAARAIETLEALGKREKVTLSIGGVSIDPQGGWAAHDALTVSLSVTGSWRTVTAFAAALETLPIASRVERATLSASPGGWFGSFTLIFLEEKP